MKNWSIFFWGLLILAVYLWNVWFHKAAGALGA